MCCFCCFAKDFGSLDRQDLATFSGPGDTEDTRGSGVHLERVVFIGERKEESNIGAQRLETHEDIFGTKKDDTG